MKILNVIVVFLACSLTACGNNNVAQTVAKIPGLGALNATPVPLTPIVLAGIDQADPETRRAINVIRLDNRVSDVFLEVARAGDRSTYLSTTRRGIILKNGIITQTQGVGGDLAGSKHASYNPNDTGRVFTKIHTTLAGDNKIHPTTYRCIRTGRDVDFYGIGAQRRLLMPIDEICRNETQKHENVYFLYPDTGKVFRSRQWVSDKIGYLRIEQISLPKP